MSYIHVIREEVSDCFNANHNVVSNEEAMGQSVKSGYQHLTKLMVDKYGLSHSDLDAVASNIENLVADYINERCDIEVEVVFGPTITL